MNFGKFDVVGQLGSGSTGVVWLAADPGVGRQVAIKQLAPELVSDTGFRDRFRGEARVLASLSSPNVVAVYDYVEDSDGAYLVEEWVDGSSLARVVEAAGRLTPAQAVGVLRGALRGLATAHEAGLVHGDVTPGNVLVAPDGTSKLIDFGLSVSSGSEGTSGTPAYASPESVQGVALDARSDVYSAGCVLFELLAGRAPYRGDTADTIAAQHVAADVPRVPGVHAGLTSLVARAMDKDPANRPRDAREFLRELEAEADRDLGVGWDVGASVAGLAIAATVTNVAASAVGGTGATTTMAHAATAAKGVRRIPKKWVIAGGVTAGTVAVAVVAALALGGDSATADVSGRWRVGHTVGEALTNSQPVGAKFDRVWTVTRTCNGGKCTTTLHAPNAQASRFTQDGDSYSGTLVTPQDCVDANGQVLVTQTGRIVQRVHFTVTRSSGGRADEFKGTDVIDIEKLKPSPCPLVADHHGREALVGTRLDQGTSAGGAGTGSSSGGSQPSGSGGSSGATVGHFDITISGDRSASFSGTGTCSLPSQPGATATYTMERGSDVFSVTGDSRWFIKAILGDSGLLINQGEEGATLSFSKDQRKVTANVDVTQQVVNSDSSVRPVRTRVTGTITCTS